MIQTLRNFADRFLGRGDATITVPSFDGALKPNQILERAEIVASFDDPEDLATDGKTIYIADGSAILDYRSGQPAEIRRFDKTVTAFCCLPDGGMAVVLDGRKVQVFSTPTSAEAIATVIDPAMTAVNAIAPGPSGNLIATNGSATRPYQQWTRDLMERGRTGSALSIDIKSGRVQTVVSGLEYAFGACAAGSESWISESWRHRVLAVSPQGRRRIVLEHLPAYPSRITPASSGGFWLTAFIARTQLVEFVLRENAYRRRMMKEIDPEYWIVPKLKSGQSFLEPMQGAHIKTMGVIKPWAAPRSYGLVVRLDSDGVPLYGLHSRVDGVNHGVVAAIEVEGALFLIAKGPGRLLRVSLSGIEQELKA